MSWLICSGHIEWADLTCKAGFAVYTTHASGGKNSKLADKKEIPFGMRNV